MDKFRLLKVKENFFSVSRHFGFDEPSVLTTVCGISSRLVQVTVVTTGTVSVPGPEDEVSICTYVFPFSAVAPPESYAGPRPSSSFLVPAPRKNAIDHLPHAFLLFNFISDQIGVS